MNKFRVGDVVVYSHDLYASVHFKKGDTFKVTRTRSDGNIVLASIDSEHKPFGTYTPDQFELVQEDAVLTPEEVFEHLRKGTKLQRCNMYGGTWVDHSRTLTETVVDELLCYAWRIKPEPEVIELNGKKYREIVD